MYVKFNEMVMFLGAKHEHESSIGRSKPPWKKHLGLRVCPRSGTGGRGFAIRPILSAASGKQFPESYAEGQEKFGALRHLNQG